MLESMDPQEAEVPQSVLQQMFGRQSASDLREELMSETKESFTLESLSYTVLGELGSGGMGKVALAREKSPLGRTVAIKYMRPCSPSEAERRRERFFAEAAIPSHIRHPNIVEIYAVGEQQGCGFIVLEYMPGARTLTRLVQEADSPIECKRLELLLAQALSGLRAVHASPGRWHRDIKPCNLLIFEPTGGGEWLKIIDFGLLHNPDKHLTEAGSRPGTIGYKAPETFRVGPPYYKYRDGDQRSDLYALGVTFFWAATGGVHPYPDAAEDDAQALEVFNRPSITVPRLKDARPDIPDALSKVITKLIEPDPQRRYQTAEEALADLGERRRPDFVTKPNAMPQTRSKYLPNVLWVTLTSALAFSAGFAIRSLSSSNEAQEQVIAANTLAPVTALNTPLSAEVAQVPPRAHPLRSKATSSRRQRKPSPATPPPRPPPPDPAADQGDFDLRLFQPPEE